MFNNAYLHGLFNTILFSSAYDIECLFIFCKSFPLVAFTQECNTQSNVCTCITDLSSSVPKNQRKLKSRIYIII